MTYIPHGIGADQIGEGADIDTGVLSGTTNGKFIGFGEDGTSAIANRAHYALSANIDHVYQEVHRDIAVPKRYDRTSPGGGESSFQFPNTDSEEIWTGDDTYPGSAGSSDLEGMQILYNILDSNYNELTDGSDNEIRVKLVRDSTDVTDVYQGGFKDQPVIHFIAVDPNTGATVTDPYTIPAATEYKIICGIKSTVAEMPADALIRFKAQSSSELEAGVLLQDGTRPLTGTLDLNDQGITDQYFSGALTLSESGQTSLYQPSSHTSLVGTVNGISEAQEMVSGNRAMDRTGSVSTGGTSNLDVTYPALKVMLQGQVVDIAGGTLTATDATDTYYLYVKPDGTVALDSDADWNDTTPLAGSVLIWRGDYNEGTDTWSNYYDLRWPSTRKGNHVSIYVGTGVGVDFTYLTQAAEYARWMYVGAAKQNTTYEIVVVGEAEVQSSVVLPDGWTLRGLSRRGHNDYSASVVTTDTASFPAGNNVIVTGDNCTVKDLTINWGRGVDQTSGYYGLQTGAHCLIESVKFTKSTNKFANNLNVGGASADDLGPVVRECYFNNFSERAIRAHGAARLRIENCTFITDSTATYHIEMLPVADTGDDRVPAATIVGCYFKGGCSSANILVGGPNVLIDSCQAELTGATTPFVLISAEEDQDSSGADIRNCLLENGYQFINCDFVSASMYLHLFVRNCICKGFTNLLCDLGATVDSGSQVVLDGNAFHGTGSSAEIAIDVALPNLRVSNNVFEGWTENCVKSTADDLFIRGNLFQSCCTKTLDGGGGVTDVAAAAISLVGGDRVIIRDNTFTGISGSAIRASYAQMLSISGNLFDGVEGRFMQTGPIRTAYAVVSIFSDDTDVETYGSWSVTENQFNACGYAYTAAQTGAITSHGIYVDTEQTGHIRGNSFFNSVASTRDDVSETYIEVGLYGNADIVFGENTFYKKLDEAENTVPYQGYYQLYGHTAANKNVVISGCVFHLVGDASSLPNNTYHCVYFAGGDVHASGCYTEGTWTQTPAGARMWDIDTCTDGTVMGCVFRGNNHVYIGQDPGFCVGNLHTAQSGKTFDAGQTATEFPTSTTYSSNPSNPRADFNRQQ